MNNIEIESLKRIDLKEGEVLIVKVPHDTSIKDQIQIGDTLRTVFPNNKIGVCPIEMKFEAINPGANNE